MEYPSKYTLKSLLMHVSSGPKQLAASGEWVPCRPLGYASFFSRVKLAWLVFTGRGDVVIWPDDQ